MSQIDARYIVQMLPTARIFIDHDFNCRGRVAQSECLDLKRSLEEKGLDFPIHVQTYLEMPERYDYRVVSGHRRLTAALMLKWVEIPSVVRTDITTEDDARSANLRENIQRTDLDIVQEANAIGWYLEKGYNINQIAERTGKSSGWVDVRRKLRELPDEVISAAKDKKVTQNHIGQLYEHRHNREKLMEMLFRIKTMAEQGAKAIVIKEDIKITDFAAVRRPKPHEVEDFMFVVANNLTNKLDAPEYFAHRCLAWCAGNISLAHAYVSLQKECANQGVAFNPPPDIKKILDGVNKV